VSPFFFIVDQNNDNPSHKQEGFHIYII